MNIIRMIKRFFGRNSEYEYRIEHGFKHGSNFTNYSPTAIDGNFPWLISIGDNVTISSDVKILAHDASTCLAGIHTKIGNVEIGSNVFIGTNSVVLCNTKIGDNVIIGAGSIVAHDLNSNGVYAGNPAKYICSFQEWKSNKEKDFENHTYFNSKKWDEWKNASPDEWAEMKKELKNTFGYV